MALQPKRRTDLGLGVGPSSRGYQLDILEQIAEDQLMNQNNQESTVPWGNILSQVAPMWLRNKIGADVNLGPNLPNTGMFEGQVDSTQTYQDGGNVPLPMAPFLPQEPRRAHDSIDSFIQENEDEDFFGLLDRLQVPTDEGSITAKEALSQLQEQERDNQLNELSGLVNVLMNERMPLSPRGTTGTPQMPRRPMPQPLSPEIKSIVQQHIDNLTAREVLPQVGMQGLGQMTPQAPKVGQAPLIPQSPMRPFKK